MCWNFWGQRYQKNLWEFNHCYYDWPIQNLWAWRNLSLQNLINFCNFTTWSNNTKLVMTWNITSSKHVLFFVNAKIIEQNTIGGYREYSIYKNSIIFVTYKMIKQYTTCEDITELSKLLCCTHSISQACWNLEKHLLNSSIFIGFCLELLITHPLAFLWRNVQSFLSKRACLLFL